jgi:hypothetical protein
MTIIVSRVMQQHIFGMGESTLPSVLGWWITHIIYVDLQGICSLWKLDLKHQNLVVQIVARCVHILVLTEINVACI